MNSLHPPLEALFLAGCAGALAPMLLGWRIPIGNRASQWKAHPAIVLLYVVLGGYVATFVLDAQRLSHAFAMGAVLDIVLAGARALASRWRLGLLRPRGCSQPMEREDDAE